MQLPVSRSPRLQISWHSFLLLFVFCALRFELTQAQYFSLGTDAASVKWDRIKTENFSVIFPRQLDSQALRTANTLEYFREMALEGRNIRTGRWPVILHNGTVIPNATTPFAPKRIDMLTIPPQDQYGQDWLDQLVIHEFRHSVQYATLDKGFTRAMRILFGQQAVPAVLGLFVPFWYIEGDATVTETAMTRTGRGRSPSFEMRLRAQVIEKGIYSYDKAYNGSYRDFIAGHYEMGYLLVGSGMLKYGGSNLIKPLQKSGTLPFTFVPFSHALYKATGTGKRKFYRNTLTELGEKWKEEDRNLDTTACSRIREGISRTYTNYTSPIPLPDGLVAALRSSLDDITRIVLIDKDGRETIACTPGPMIDPVISARGNMICWAELENDPRWALRDYSVIKVHDQQSGRTRQITHKSRYFSPDPDPSAKAIAVVEVDMQNSYYITLVNAADGHAIKRFPVPGNHYPSHPVWSNDGRRIAVILTRSEGKCIAVLDIETAKFEIALPFSYTEISKPTWHEHYILFTGAYTGIDNIFALDLNTGELYQATSARFGATDAAISADGKTLYYASYSSGGYDIVATGFSALSDASHPGDPDSLNPWNPQNNYSFELADGLSEQVGTRFDASAVPDSGYTIRRYCKGLNLFNFHSWAPLYLDIDHLGIQPGVTLMSQNLLASSFATIGWAYDLNTESGKYMLKYSYEGLYPAFDINLDYGLRHGVIDHTIQENIIYKYHELNTGGWVRVPLNWNIGSWFAGVQPFAGYSYIFRRMLPDQEVEFRKDRFHSVNGRIYAYVQRRMSARDLYPRWAAVTDLNFRHTLFEADTSSSLYSAELSLYLPGLFKHHSLRLYGGYQQRIYNYYPYSDQVSVPRGHSGIALPEIACFSVDYRFPAAYPDWSVGPLVYIKRIKAGIFYDYALQTGTSSGKMYQTVGADLTFDFHLLRHFTPFEAGIRIDYLPQYKQAVFEILYSIGLGN